MHATHLDNILGAARHADCVSAFRAALTPLGIDTFSAGEVDTAHRSRSTFTVIDWPESWRRFYFTSGILERDPLVENLGLYDGRPFTWNDLRADRRLARLGTEGLDLALQEGWRDGLCVPLHRSGTHYGIVSIVAREAIPDAHREVMFVPGKNVSADDFDSPVETSGQITFSNGQTGKGFGLRVKNDGKSEGIESFTIKLSDPDGGVLGWSKDVTVYIIDGDGTGEAPTSIKLSDISLKENSKTNTTLGTLSTKDGDNGDQFTYELIKDAGGRYKIVGDKIKVADGSLLDYEQSHSNTIKVRSTDLLGNSIDKKFTIKLENVDPEKLKGNADANKLFGGAEADTINGGLGNDTLKGNGAADRFVFDIQLDATANVDHIVDFKHDLDKIALDKDIFKKLSGKVLSDDFFHAAATAHDKNDHILYQQKSGMLFYDADGKKPGADPVLFAVLDNHAKIDAGDLVIV